MTISTHGLGLDKIVWNHTPPEQAISRETGRAFHYISDHMDATWHPHTGQVLDSKSAFRKITRDHGYVEVGNDVQTQARPVRERAGADVKRAIEQLRSR